MISPRRPENGGVLLKPFDFKSKITFFKDSLKAMLNGFIYKHNILILTIPAFRLIGIMPGYLYKLKELYLFLFKKLINK